MTSRASRSLQNVPLFLVGGSARLSIASLESIGMSASVWVQPSMREHVICVVTFRTKNKGFSQCFTTRVIQCASFVSVDLSWRDASALLSVNCV